MFTLLRYFSIMSLITFVVVTAVLAAFYRQTALNDLIALEESKNVALTRASANSHWQQFAPFVTSASGLSADELRAHPEIARLHQAVTAQMNGLSVLKVKIYNLEGLTVFSTEAKQIGDDKSANAGFLSARSGKVASELTHRDTFSAFEGTVEDRDVLSSYIPVGRGGPTAPIEGVFELYSDVTPFLERLERTQADVVIVVTLTLASLYVALFFIVRHADGIIQRQHIESERAEEALQEAHEELERRVDKRTAQLQASAEVGRAAASILDPDQLLREVVTLITNRFGFYYAAIFTLDEAGKFAVLREATGEAGRALKERGHKLEVGGQSMVGYVTAQRKPRIALNVGEEPIRFANPLLPETRSDTKVRSRIALPLVVGDRALGALDVQSTQEAAFDEASAAVLQTLADQVAVALNNAEQFRRAERQASAQANLLKAALELAGQPNREALFDLITHRAMELFRADGASIWLPVGNDEIAPVAAINVGQTEMAGQRLRKGEGLSGKVFATGNALRIDNYRAWAGADGPFHAALCVPTTWRGQVTGVLAITASQPGTVFTADDERAAQLFAAQVASAIEGVQLLEQQQRTLNELDAVNRRLTGQAWAEQFQRLPAGAQHAQFVQGSLQPIEVDWLPEIELAVTAMKPVAWSQRQDQTLSSPFQAAMAAPIVLRGEVIGALQVGEASRPRAWSAEDLAFIQAVADQVALAVENARLIDETQRAAQREKTIADVADKIHRPIDLESILRTAVEEVSRITGAGEVSIQLGVGARSNGNGTSSITSDTRT